MVWIPSLDVLGPKTKHEGLQKTTSKDKLFLPGENGILLSSWMPSWPIYSSIRDHLSMSGDIFVRSGKVLLASIYWAEARDAAKRPAMH